MPKKIESGQNENSDSEEQKEWRTSEGETGVVLGKKFVKEVKQKRTEQMRKETEIPPDVKAGTANAVWYELRNAEILQNRQLTSEERSDWRKATKKRAGVLARKYSTERYMLNDCIYRANVDEAFESTGKGDYEDDKKKKKIHENQLNSCSAREMYDLIQKHKIDPIEAKDLKLLTEDDKETLEAAKELQSRLTTESIKASEAEQK